MPRPLIKGMHDSFIKTSANFLRDKSIDGSFTAGGSFAVHLGSLS